MKRDIILFKDQLLMYFVFYELGNLDRLSNFSNVQIGMLSYQLPVWSYNKKQYVSHLIYSNEYKEFLFSQNCKNKTKQKKKKRRKTILTGCNYISSL